MGADRTRQALGDGLVRAAIALAAGLAVHLLAAPLPVPFLAVVALVGSVCGWAYRQPVRPGPVRRDGDFPFVAGDGGGGGGCDGGGCGGGDGGC